jgi:hypothetical protein
LYECRLNFSYSLRIRKEDTLTSRLGNPQLLLSGEARIEKKKTSLTKGTLSFFSALTPEREETQLSMGALCFFFFLPLRRREEASLDRLIYLIIVLLKELRLYFLNNFSFLY